MQIEHSEYREGTDYDNDTTFKYKTAETLSTFASDNGFKIIGEYYSQMQGTVRTHITLSVDEAKRLKNELEAFIKQHE